MSLMLFAVRIRLIFGLYVIFVRVLLFFIFFFKQKTAYELRISDWSSDVCSSDLPADVVPAADALRALRAQGDGYSAAGQAARPGIVQSRQGFPVSPGGRPIGNGHPCKRRAALPSAASDTSEKAT